MRLVQTGCAVAQGHGIFRVLSIRVKPNISQLLHSGKFYEHPVKPRFLLEELPFQTCLANLNQEVLKSTGCLRVKIGFPGEQAAPWSRKRTTKHSPPFYVYWGLTDES